MALSDNPFIGIALAQLLLMQQQWIQVLTDIATTGQSYTFPNRSLSRANLPEVRQTLVDLRYAIAAAAPTGTNAGKQIAQVTIDTQSRFAGP